MEASDDIYTRLPRLTKYRSEKDEAFLLPIYHQVTLVQQDCLETHWLSSGAPFFSKKEVADALGVRRLTMSRAIKDLVENGYLTRDRGQRAVVADLYSLRLLHMGSLNLSEMPKEMGVDYKMELLETTLERESHGHVYRHWDRIPETKRSF